MKPIPRNVLLHSKFDKNDDADDQNCIKSSFKGQTWSIAVNDTFSDATAFEVFRKFVRLKQQLNLVCCRLLSSSHLHLTDSK